MMMKRILLTLVLVAAVLIQGQAQAEPITDAKARGAESTVTVSGVVTNGDELGPIRYIQDATGGLAIYDPDKMGDVVLGDSITVTGVLVDYNNLLEIQPVSSLTVEKENASLPAPLELTPSQVGEAYEGMLVNIEKAVFDKAGQAFAAQTNYDFTASGESGVIRISNVASPFVGKVIPSGETNITGILSQFYETYQILVRLEDDIVSSSSINFVSPPRLSNLSTEGFTLNWDTDAEGSTEILYGHTPGLELGKMTMPGNSTTHTVTISGAGPSELFYIWPYSVSGSDTAKAGTRVYITQSTSSGDMKAFFNRPVDHSVSTGSNALYLDHAIDDTLIAYINRATESIEFSAYNFNNFGISSIADALNAAHQRGVTVRVVYDINQLNFGTDDLLDDIGKMASPESDYYGNPSYGIMHNKFVVFDANSADPDKAIVWTGATNFTDGQINIDPNNVIVVQDKSLAIAFWLEFNEMFGSAGAQPDPGAARFGPVKKDNTPHEFIIGGKEVECYFSPSDNTHTKILETLNSADNDLNIATMLITKTDLAYAIRDRFESGVAAQVLVKDVESTYEVVIDILKSSLQDKFRVSGEAGIMHHKYAIVDQGAPDSDPIILTGSHNWSSSAQNRNDENTLIIHDQDLANQYYQEFVMRYKAGLLLVDAPVCKKDFVTMSSGTKITYDVMYNDEIPGPVHLEITRQPTNGTAVVQGDQTITYTPDASFRQDLDTVYYKVSMEANPAIADSSMMVVFVNLPLGVDALSASLDFSIYPNPAGKEVNISWTGDSREISVSLVDLSGRLVRQQREIPDREGGYTLSLEGVSRGYYMLRLSDEKGNTAVQPLLVTPQ